MSGGVTGGCVSDAALFQGSLLKGSLYECTTQAHISVHVSVRNTTENIEPFNLEPTKHESINAVSLTLTYN